ncbi:MAG: radical SAM protein [Thermodesulfovibrionales bacterium]|nr:radical SAM protein [Thermodesulfovibrionales bacterium]
MKLLMISRKTQVLKQPAFGCLKDVPSINITRGCIHGCLYCYARGFSYAPPEGELHIYQDTHKFLEKELDRKRRLPQWVSFSTASDAFQNVDEILEETYSCMKLLLERGIGISFLTKGTIPEDFINLFKKHPYKVKARIGIVSVDEGYRKLFEPRSAKIYERLRNLSNLIKAGIESSVRVDPVIPEITDSEHSVEALLRSLKEAGVKEISVSSLVMRPSIIDSLNKIPPKTRWRLLRLYRGQPWQRVITSARTRLLPPELRKSIYERFRSIAQSYVIEMSVCGCKNPDLPWEYCSPWVNRDRIDRQMALFSREAHEAV